MADGGWALWVSLVEGTPGGAGEAAVSGVAADSEVSVVAHPVGVALAAGGR